MQKNKSNGLVPLTTPVRDGGLKRLRIGITAAVLASTAFLIYYYFYYRKAKAKTQLTPEISQELGKILDRQKRMRSSYSKLGSAPRITLTSEVESIDNEIIKMVDNINKIKSCDPASVLCKTMVSDMKPTMEKINKGIITIQNKIDVAKAGAGANKPAAAAASTATAGANKPAAASTATAGANKPAATAAAASTINAHEGKHHSDTTGANKPAAGGCNLKLVNTANWNNRGIVLTKHTGPYPSFRDVDNYCTIATAADGACPSDWDKYFNSSPTPTFRCDKNKWTIHYNDADDTKSDPFEGFENYLSHPLQSIKDALWISSRPDINQQSKLSLLPGLSTF